MLGLDCDKMKLLYLWFKNYIKHPLEIGAIFPTSKITSKLMASELDIKNKQEFLNKEVLSLILEIV